MSNPAVIMRVPWQPGDADTKCQWCFGPNPLWFVDDQLWNQVMGVPDQEAGAIVCPTCFLVRAQESPTRPVWEIVRRTPEVLSQREYHRRQGLRAAQGTA